MEHVTIATDKFKESVDFYKNLLGLKVLGEISKGPIESCFLGEDESSTKIELIKSDKSPGFEGISIGFKTENLDKKIGELKEKEIPYEGPISPIDNISFIFIEDPNGLKIQFM